jgi:hypothetical protein
VFSYLRPRASAIVLAPVVVAAGLGSRAVLDGLPGKVAGDALYTVLIYVLVLVVRPAVRPARAFAVALGFSFAIELFQLTPYPAWLSSQHILLRLIFGTTFGLIDLAGYLLGALFAVGLHTMARTSPARVCGASPRCSAGWWR